VALLQEWVLYMLTIKIGLEMPTINVPHASHLPEYRPRPDVSLPLEDDTEFLPVV
jgi:hypothetical protein